MEYSIEKCVWEITQACNLRCSHCGSSCKEAGPDELDTTEMLEICDQLANMKVSSVGITGGEPFVRKDWKLLIRRLDDLNLPCGIVSNGLLIDEEMVKYLKDYHVKMVAVSLDGTKEIHNRIRQADCFDRSVAALKLMQKNKISTGVITTLQRGNFKALKDMLQFLTELRVKTWQLQLCFPMGNMEGKRDQMLSTKEIKEVIDFAYYQNKKNGVAIQLADNIGYYTLHETYARKRFVSGEAFLMWQGCSAGIRSLGILSNGDVTACTAIRSTEFIEGNLRVKSLRSIWENPNAFAWRRNLKTEQLKGYCKTCDYRDLCLGGCTNMRLVTEGSIYSENKYCVVPELSEKRKQQ